MLRIRHLFSSSGGNAYVLETPDGALLLDCGRSLRDLRVAYPNVVGVEGVLLTHEHMDHAKGAEALLGLGIPVYMSEGTHHSIGPFLGLPVKIVTAMQKFSVPGGFTVYPFPAVHDAAEPLCYLIAYGNARVLYLTDTGMVLHKFPGVTHLMIEVNYVDEIMDLSENTTLARRVRNNHLSLKDALKVVKTNKDTLKEIHLLHLSDANSDEQQMKLEVQRATGVPVYVAPR